MVMKHENTLSLSLNEIVLTSKSLLCICISNMGFFLNSPLRFCIRSPLVASKDLMLFRYKPLPEHLLTLLMQN